MDEDEIRAALAALHADVIAIKRGPVESSVTVEVLARRYAESIEFTRLKAIATNRGHVARIVRLFGERDAAALGMREIDELRASMRELAPATRNLSVVRLTAMLRWGTTRGHLSRYPLPRVPLERTDNERTTSRSETDVMAIVAALRASGRHVAAAIVVTAADSGTRRGEVCYLRWDQLDVTGGTISLLAAETKGKRGRSTVLSAWASSMILATPRTASPYVFCSSRGRPFHPRTVLRYYQQACDEAGVQPADGERNVFHDLRGAFADQQIAIGTPVPDVMAMAGWRDYRTMRRYLRRPAQAIAAEAKARLEATRKKPKKTPPKDTHTDPVCAETNALATKSTEPSSG